MDVEIDRQREGEKREREKKGKEEQVSQEREQPVRYPRLHCNDRKRPKMIPNHKRFTFLLLFLLLPMDYK